ncbi:hypothetical protein ID866_9371 [Astraeus odoratus]|nr:hypothetical protein ID866_9371 [Astraeus odoratus]
MSNLPPSRIPQDVLAEFVKSEQYHNSFLISPDDALEGALKRSQDNGLPNISVSVAQGKFLKLIALSIGAKRILEIGTLGGYSTIWMAQALPGDGELVTLEISEENAKIARDNLDRAGIRNVKIVVGNANDTLASLLPVVPFDMVFIDADKASYPNYFVEAKRLLRKGGVVTSTFLKIADNTVRDGRVADQSYTNPHLEGIRTLLTMLKNDEEVDATNIATVGEKDYDGFLYAVKL